ncbi:NIPSNAP family protein [Rhodobacteraceae bacterium F11138]|nr:NIPSNAP family protein [Rhodobacteraceae bacterium F11138]
MIIEERIYTLKIGALKQYRALYLNGARQVQRQILGNCLGYYFTEVGTQNQVVHLWQYDSFEERSVRRAKLMENPIFQSFMRESAHLLECQENRILKPLIE